MKHLTVVILALPVLLLACERTIDLEVDDANPKLVVEATIENGEPPVSLGFFSKITPDLLAGSFVHNADVFISNGTLTHKLKEYEVPVIPGYSLFYYSIDSSSLSTSFEGELNSQYSLRIIHESQHPRRWKEKGQKLW
jgi:hypothetical protein